MSAAGRLTAAAKTAPTVTAAARPRAGQRPRPDRQRADDLLVACDRETARPTSSAASSAVASMP